MSDPIEKLFTIEEVAEILRVSTRSVNRYIESPPTSRLRQAGGRLKASKIGVWRLPAFGGD